MKSSFSNGIMSLIAAILHQFSLFPLFMMSNIIPFMISYLYQTEKESSPDNTSSLTQNDGYFIHPIMELSMSICCFFGGMAEHYLGPRLSFFYYIKKLNFRFFYKYIFWNWICNCNDCCS